MTKLKSRPVEYTAMEGSMGETKNSVAPVEGQTYVQKDVEDDEGGPCGWGRIIPRCCQRFRNPKWVLFWLCWAGAIQGMVVNGFVNVVISNIERRFEISSTESGTIASCYDIASVLCLIPVTYFGGLGIKPRYLGIGVFIMGVGSIIFSLPHFTTDSFRLQGSQENICQGGSTANGTCSSSGVTQDLSNYKYVFFFGQLLHGAGASPLYTLGVTYIDENVPLRSSSFYVGIFYSFAIVGPAIGYLAGGEFLKIFTDFSSIDATGSEYSTDNPRWVGAWWIGFLISGALAFIVCLPLSGFPRSLPGSRKYMAERGKEVYKGSSHDNAQKIGNKRGVKDILLSIKLLVTNPTFMFLNFAAASEGILLSGFSTFAPKFIEAQFSLPASSAAQYVGFAAIPAGGGGTFLGGYIVKRFNLKLRGIVKFCLCATISVLFIALIFLVNCENVPFAGINVKYNDISNNKTISFLGGKQLEHTCNSGCGCQEEEYNPVCGRDGLMYFSPCYAGCHVSQVGDVKRYSNCSCVNHNATDYMAELGKCETSCIWLPVFMPFFSIIMLLTFITSMPALSATLRCVPEHQRSFGLGIQWIIARCLGSIPGPILFGKMIDLTCLLWQKTCDGEGSCFFYDNRQMSYYLLALSVALKAASSLFFFLALCLYKKPKETIEDKVLEESSMSAVSSTSRTTLNHDTPQVVVKIPAVNSDQNGIVKENGNTVKENGNAVKENGNTVKTAL